MTYSIINTYNVSAVHFIIEKEDMKMSEEKKVVAPVEINDEELDLVAGGAYTREEWEAMSTAERAAAQQRSRNARRNNRPCEMD